MVVNLGRLLLRKFGRREGMEKIFTGIRNFIENSPITRRQSGRGTTFHETMTYFWTHMVHFAIASNSRECTEFKEFLVLNPVLCNGGLFLHYYSRQRMLLDPEARSAVLLPDKKPLPSLITSVDRPQGPAGSNVMKVEPKLPSTDEEFLRDFEERKLAGWGHEVKLRYIYVKFAREGRSSSSVEEVLKLLEDVEGAGYHVTLNYFWIQMITYYIAVVRQSMQLLPEFKRFIAMPNHQRLLNQLLYSKYYSNAVIDSGEKSLQFPDIKPLPSKI